MDKAKKLMGKVQDWISGVESQSKRTKRGREREQFFHLDEDAIKRLESIAGSRNLALQSALEQAVYFYYRHQGEQPKRISEDRKERNPLLLLEGLMSGAQQSMDTTR